MSTDTPAIAMPADTTESPSQPSLAPSDTTPRPHRHRRRRQDLLPSSAPTTANNTNNASGTDQNLLAANNRSSVASNRSNNRRGRRSTTANRAGAAFDLLGNRIRNGLTICCDGVSVRCNHRDVIDEVSCLLRGGRVTAVVNCCGTHSALALLTAIAGRVDCAAGNIVMNGVPVSASTYQAQMSFVEEDATSTDDSGATSDLLSELTVRENLAYASALRVANSAQAYSVEEILQQLLLESHADTRICDCSLYVRRRVALGKELLLNPSVLLLDEPMDGLATHEAQQFLSILLKLAAPSAADAEARYVMREAMSAASAEASISGEVDVIAAMSAADPPTSSARLSLYTPRHSRADPLDIYSSGSGGLASVPSSSARTHRGSKSWTVNCAAGHECGASLSDTTQRVVVLSMVQPRWALLQYVHDVVLLERSRCAFVGTVQEMLSVNLPKSVFQPRTTDTFGSTNSAAAAATFPTDDDYNKGDNRLTGVSAQVGAAGLPEDAPAGSYDAVAASIHRTRLNEELIHGLYRLAAATSWPTTSGGVVGVTTAANLPDFSSFNENLDDSEPQLNIPAAGARPSRSSSFVAVRADGHYAAPLSQLYTVQFGHARAQVTAYMEGCAEGLFSLPEASHQTPSGFIQLFHLFRFGFVELRHNFLSDLIALIVILTVAAALAALYGVQIGDRGIQNCAGILFFLVCCVVLQAVLSLDAQRREYAAFYRYSRSGYYAAWTFLIFRAVTAALWRFGLASFVALVVFALSNFGEPWREYHSVFELGVIMAVLSYCCYFLIWFLCAWWPSDRVSRFVVFTFYTLNIVLAGLVLNLATLPRGVRGLSLLSVMRLAYESAILTNFAGKTFGCNETSSGGSIGVADGARASMRSVLSKSSHGKSGGHQQADIKGRRGAHSSLSITTTSLDTRLGLQGTRHRVRCYTGAEYAAYMGFEASHRWSNVGILAGLSAVLLLACWVMMTLYQPRRRLKVTA